MSVEQLAERLRAMEELNRKLSEQLEYTNRAHDQQMKQLLERVAELSTRLGNGTEREARQGGAAGPVLPPMDDSEQADLGSPVPEYYSFQREPPFPDRHYRLSNINSPE
jgi:phosphate-selective porin OprO/OprP